MGKKKIKKKSTPKPVYKCELCEDVDNTKPVVACDKCDKWHHFACVNIVSIGKNDPWICPKCKSPPPQVNKPKTLIQPIYSCQLCNRADNDEMILCDGCDQKYHFICVDLEAHMDDQPWKCVQCGEVVKSTLRQRTSIPKEHTPSLDFSNLSQKCHEIPHSQRPISEQSSRYSHRTFGINTTGNYQRPIIEQNIYNDREFDRNSHYEHSEFIQISSKSRMSSHRIKVELDCLEEEMNLRSKWEREREAREQEYLERKYQLIRQGCQSSRKGSQASRMNDIEKWVNDSVYKRPDQSIDKDSFHMSEFERRVNKLKFETTSPKIKENHVTNEPVYESGPTVKIQAENEVEDKQPQMKVINPTSTYQKPPEAESESRFPDSIPTQTISSVMTLNKSQIAARHVVNKKLPIFSGDPLEWMEWITTYEDTTKLCGFTDGENIGRLKECLRGKAREKIKHRLLTPSAVPKIIETLRMLYGRPELIVNIVLNNIKDIPVPKADKLETLVDYAMEIKNISATIEASKLSYHLTSPTLIQEIVEKLPSQTKIEWARFKATQVNITLSTLADWLYNLAEVVCTVTVPSTLKKSEIKSEKKSSNKWSEQVNLHQEGNKKENQSNATGERSASNVTAPTTQKPCWICKKSCKKVEDCSNFKSYQISDRWKAVFDAKICRICLRGHKGFCKSNKKCGVNGCTFKHHSLLHDENRYAKTSLAPNQNENKTSLAVVPAIVKNNSHNSLTQDTILRIIPVKLHFNGLSIKTFAFLDEGSTTTLIDQKFADALRLVGAPKTLCLLWSGKVHRTEENSQLVELKISSINDVNVQYPLRGVRTVQCLGLSGQNIKKSELLTKFPHLNGIPFNGYVGGVPGILIGSNNSMIGVPLQVIEGGEFEPIAYRTRIGWTIHGPTSEINSINFQSVNIHSVEKCPYQHDHDEDLHQKLKDHFTVENFGVQASSNLNLCSKDDERAMKLLKEFTKLVDGRFETALLWRYDSIDLPDSYGMARKRLICLEKHKPKLVEVITETIKDYVRKGYVRKLMPEEIQITSPKTWYLPIFAVTYPKKPDKIRTVFDAAAKVNGISLNSVLLKGPDELSSLLDILRRFREKCVAITGDIKEMYHQVRIRNEDQQAQRFLWRNGETSREPDIYVMNVMTFGSTCSPSAAQFVKNQNAVQFLSESPRAVQSITKNHYVDDMLDGEDNEEKTIELVNEVKRIHKHAGFEIRNFLSNSTKVMEAIGEHQDDLTKSLSFDVSLGTERVLGMWWNTKTDCFTFSLKYSNINDEILSGKRMPTKREMLKTLMSIFDPLGLLSHYLIHLKILLQDVWRSKNGWDEQISTKQMKDAWINWSQLLPNVEEVQLPRLYSIKMSPGTPSSTQLHIFVDASEQAFSAVAYIRVEDEYGADCSLIGSKARVAPLKYMSIPRKELQSAILGSRLATSIGLGQTFKIDRRIIWTDSMTVLSWLYSDHRKYHQFVAHRIGEILENTNLSEWRWIPSKQNVADEATKWIKSPSFQPSNRWFAGPDFLTLPEENWPKNKVVEYDTEDEMKVHLIHSELITSIVINPENISKWEILVKAVAYALRFTRILRAKIRNQQIIRGFLSSDELALARNVLFQQAQNQIYPEEMAILKGNRNLSKDQQKSVRRSSTLFKLSPYIDDNGIMRVRGRIDAAENIPHYTKRPIILPRQSLITQLLVGWYHRVYHHRYRETVINEICQKFYISGLRTLLKSMKTSECQWCKNRFAKPSIPEMSGLPYSRLAIGFRAFTYTGIDFFGPIHVVVGRRNEKRWGVMFTCLTIRAIHIEIAHSMDTGSAIMCLRNFIARKGRPTEIYSDNGTNLIGMDNELSRAVAKIDFNKMASEFNSDFKECYSKWCFNPPSAPHMGGAWERMIRSVKDILYDIMPTRKPTDEMLKNLLMEIEFIINSRPLTFVPLDYEEDEALTPNHFLVGSSDGSKPFIPMDISGENLKFKWKENQRLTDLFWRRFTKEYLPMLTRRTKWFTPVDPIMVGDIVLIIDENNRRNSYPKARVVETIVGSNGQVRKARVQKADKTLMWRSTHNLAKLDIRKPEVSLAVESKDSKTEGSVTNGITVFQQDDNPKLTTDRSIDSHTISETKSTMATSVLVNTVEKH